MDRSTFLSGRSGRTSPCIVEVGDIDPEQVTIPGIFVQRVVQAPRIVRWLDGHETL